MTLSIFPNYERNFLFMLITYQLIRILGGTYQSPSLVVVGGPFGGVLAALKPVGP